MYNLPRLCQMAPPSNVPAAVFSPETVTPTAPAERNPAPPAQVPVVEGAAPPAAPKTPGKSKAAHNPIHRPVFRGVGKKWLAPRSTGARHLILKNPSHVMRAPKATVGAVVAGMAGYTATGMTGGALDMVTNFVAGKAGVATNPIVEPVRDFVRISGEGFLGGAVYPQVTYRLVHGIGGAVSKKARVQAKNAGRGVWLGSVLLTGIDLFGTLLKYGDRAVKTIQGKALPAASGPSALSALGLGSLADLLKGPSNAGASALAGVAGTAETVSTAEQPSTSEVAGLEGEVSEVGEVAALQRELHSETARNRELKSLTGLSEVGAGALMR